MTTTQLREKLTEEIRKIPDADLEQALDLLHAFRTGLPQAKPDSGAQPEPGILRFAGDWRDAPELDGLEDELASRRRGAFKTRRIDEAGAR
jgi:hypothetical protein